MKFTPETLLQIYMNGSFTEEAQSAFDDLMRRDTSFAQKVTEALAERLEGAPESTVDQITVRLDGKIGAIWQQNKPSVLSRGLKLAARWVLILSAVSGIGWGLHHLWPSVSSLFHSRPGVSSQSGLDKASEMTGQTDQAVNTDTSNQAAEEQAILMRKASPQPKSKHPSSAMAAVSHTTAPQANPSSSSAVSPDSSTAQGNSLRIAIETGKVQKVVVTVLNPDGVLIRYLYQGGWEPGNHNVDWDGKDASGNMVSPGKYTVVVNADGKSMSGVVTIQPNQ